MSGSPDPKVACLPRGGAAAAFLVLLILLLASLPEPARGEDFTIRSFRADIEVRADSSLRIAETIEADFHRPRHGLYRDIPFRYTDELGKKSVTPIRVVSVTDPSGAGWKYKASRSGGSLRIRIGDADRFVEGRQVYVITYIVENGVLPFPDHDELDWNVTGNDWPVPIESAAAMAGVEGEVRDLTLSTRCYTGPRGSREEACTVSAGGNRASFVSTRKFRSGEGMTIVLGWERGRPPGFRLENGFHSLNLPENWVFAAPCSASGSCWSAGTGKEGTPSRGPLVVAYAPPEEAGRPSFPPKSARSSTSGSTRRTSPPRSSTLP
jgi:hypothetical protein